MVSAPPPCRSGAQAPARWVPPGLGPLYLGTLLVSCGPGIWLTLRSGVQPAGVGGGVGASLPLAHVMSNYGSQDDLLVKVV
jgi:hypothetical protein